MKHAFRLLLALTLSLFSFGAVAENERDRTVQLDLKAMAVVKADITTKKLIAPAQKAYDVLIEDANKALQHPLESVTFKQMIPPSDDKHDYLSISRYWWPNTTTANGLPWEQRDGETNPTTQSDQVDRNRLGRFVKTVRNLSLAYYFTDNEDYAIKAIQLVDTWFLDEKTKMNPNLKYAQMVPGNPSSRSSGILDGRLIGIHLLDSVALLSHSKSWSPQQQKDFDGWVKNYLDWLTSSKLGREALKKTNNHGSWYRFHVAAVAWYLGETTTVKKMIDATKRSIFVHIDSEGKQKQELRRTRSYFYSYFNLDAQTRTAIIANKMGVDLWRYVAPSEVSLITAIDYLATYSDGTVKWPHPSKGPEIALMQTIFLRAEAAFKDGRYKKLLALDPYAETKFGKTTSYLKVEEQERYLLNSYY